MQIRSESEDEKGNEQEDIISELIFEKSENVAYQLKIMGASHMNFWDFPLFFKMRLELIVLKLKESPF